MPDQPCASWSRGDQFEGAEQEADGLPASVASTTRAWNARRPPRRAVAIDVPGALHLQVRVEGHLGQPGEQVLAAADVPRPVVRSGRARRTPARGSPRWSAPPAQRLVEPLRRPPDGVTLRHRSCALFASRSGRPGHRDTALATTQFGCEDCRHDHDSLPRLAARTSNFNAGLPRGFVVSPDGQRVVFLRSSSGTSMAQSLWLFDVGTGENASSPIRRRCSSESSEQLTAEGARQARTDAGARVGHRGVQHRPGRARAAFALSSRLFVVDLPRQPHESSRRPRR